MKFDCSPYCDICKKPKGRHFDHTKCSKIKQKLNKDNHKTEAKPLTASAQEHLCKLDKPRASD